MRLTDAAAERIKAVMAKAERPIAAVRVGVKNGGCAGMSYFMEYAESVNPLDEVIEDKGVRILIVEARFYEDISDELFKGATRALDQANTAAVLTRVPPLMSFFAMTVLSLFAIVLLPRQFHVAVVENHSEAEIRRAAWLFPVYLVLINLFVLPIAMAGLLILIGSRFRIRPPALFALYVSFYTAFRSYEETLRIDLGSHYYLGFRLNFFVSLALFAASTAFFVWWQFIRPANERPAAQI